MIGFRRWWSAVVVAVVMAWPTMAAAGKPDLGQPDYALSDASGNGLMVVSMTMPWFRSGHPKNARWQLFFGKPAARLRKSITLEHQNFYTGRRLQNDFAPDRFGSVFALEMPAGDYVLRDWLLDGNTIAVTFRPNNAQPVPFRIVAGRATYVGNLDMAVGTGENVLGMAMIGQVSVQLRDDADRDIEIFLRKWPGVRRDQVDVEVQPAPGWTGGETEKTMKQPVPVPTPD